MRIKRGHLTPTILGAQRWVMTTSTLSSLGSPIIGVGNKMRSGYLTPAVSGANRKGYSSKLVVYPLPPRDALRKGYT